MAKSKWLIVIIVNSIAIFLIIAQYIGLKLVVYILKHMMWFSGDFLYISLDNISLEKNIIWCIVKIFIFWHFFKKKKTVKRRTFLKNRMINKYLIIYFFY